VKFERNEKCWCGSGLKYKNCHIFFDERLQLLKQQGELVPDHTIIKNVKQLEGIRESGKINTWVLNEVSQIIKAGMSTEEIDRLVNRLILSKGAIPATLGYQGYPKSACTSVNHEICHGIPDKDVILKDGDIINVDITTIYQGYFADASRMFMIGNVSSVARRLVAVTKECLELGIQAVKPWGHLGDIGDAVWTHAKANGYTVMADIGGHGTGLEFHEEPYVCHIGYAGEGMVLVPGMVFTIEPMINEGTDEFYTDEENGWTVYTADGKLSAQWEHTIAVTEEGIEILTH